MAAARPPKGPVGPFLPSSSEEPMTANETAVLVCTSAAMGFLIFFFYAGSGVAALFGAVAGLLAAWLQRGLRLRSHLRRRLWSSPMTVKFWTDARPTAAAQILVGAVAGIVAGGLTGWIGLPIEASRSSSFLSVGQFGVGRALLFVMLSLTACIMIYVLLNPILGNKNLEEAIKGGTDSEAAQSVASLLLHKPREFVIDGGTGTFYWARLLKPSAVEGTVHGVMVCVFLIGARLC